MSRVSPCDRWRQGRRSYGFPTKKTRHDSCRVTRVSPLTVAVHVAASECPGGRGDVERVIFSGCCVSWRCWNTDPLPRFIFRVHATADDKTWRYGVPGWSGRTASDLSRKSINRHATLIIGRRNPLITSSLFFLVVSTRARRRPTWIALRAGDVSPRRPRRRWPRDSATEATMRRITLVAGMRRCDPASRTTGI
jgi:hypothetical protein